MYNHLNFDDVYLSITKKIHPEKTSRQPAEILDLIESNETKMVRITNKELFTNLYFFFGLILFNSGLMLLSVQSSGFSLGYLILSMFLMFFGLGVSFVGQSKKNNMLKEYNRLEKYILDLRRMNKPISDSGDFKIYNSLIGSLESESEAEYFRSLKEPKYMHLEYLKDYQDIHDPITLTGQ